MAPDDNRHGATPARRVSAFLTSNFRLLCILGSTLLITTGCRNGAAPVMPPRPPAQVTVAAAIARDVPVYLDEIGRIVPIDSVAVIPQVGGKIIAAHLKDGAFVNKGDLLFEIDDRPFKAAVALAEATLSQNKAELELADVEYKRVQDLMTRAIATPLEFDQRRVAKDIANAKVEWAVAALEQAKLDLEHTRIVSPVSGRAGARMIDAGNVVKANEQPLVTIQRLDPIYAEFTVTENDLGTVRKFAAAEGREWGEHPEEGLRVEVDVPASSARILTALGAPRPANGTKQSGPGAQATGSSNDAIPSEPGAGASGSGSVLGPRTGQLVFLDNAVQETTGTVKLRAMLDNADHYFWPGQFVNVRLVLTTKENAVLIPEKARQIGREGSFVYVVSDQNIPSMRPVVLGQRHGEFMVADRGLEKGERVVVTGQMGIAPGEAVKVVGVHENTTTQPVVGSANMAAASRGTRGRQGESTQGVASP